MGPKNQFLGPALLFFTNTLYFRAILGLQQNWMEGIVIFPTPSARTHA